MVDLGAEYPVLVADGETWRLFTAMFLHFGLFHLAVNAYSLFILGNVLEREVGRRRFLAALPAVRPGRQRGVLLLQRRSTR